MIPDSQKEIYDAKLAGIVAEYDIREGIIDSGTDAKLAGEEVGIKLAVINADNEVTLNYETNLDKIELSKIGLDSDRNIAVIRGEQKVDLAELGAELGLERAVIVGQADHDGKVLVAENRAVIDAELAEQRGVFKSDFAAIDGEFRVEISELNADSTKAVSDVRISGLESASDIKILGIEREASIEADSIYQRSATTINIGDIDTEATQESLTLTGQTNDSIHALDAQQSITFVGAESEQKILTDRAIVEQKIVNGESRAAIEIQGINENSGQDIVFLNLESSQKISNEASQTLAEIDAKDTITTIEISYDNDISDVKIAGISDDASLKAINIGQVVDIETLSDQTISTIENAATLEAARIDSSTDDTLASIERQGDYDETQDKIANINTLSSTRNANTITIAQAEALVDLVAAQQSASYIESQTLIRTGDIRASASDNVQRIIDMSALSIDAIIKDAIAYADSAVSSATVGAEYAEAVANYINDLSVSTSEKKQWFNDIVARANQIKETHSYTISSDEATPTLPNLGGFSPYPIPEPPKFSVSD